MWMASRRPIRTTSAPRRWGVDTDAGDRTAEQLFPYDYELRLMNSPELEPLLLAEAAAAAAAKRNCS